VSTPGWILVIFAVIMLLVAAVSAVRLALAGPWRRDAASPDSDVDSAHLLMGIAMAGMLVAALTTLPNDAWDVIFAALTAWFAWSAYRESRADRRHVLTQGHKLPHLVHSAAMLYMFVAVTAHATGGMSGMGGSSGGTQTLRFPLLAFIFSILLVGYAVLDLDRLTGPAHGDRALSRAMAPRQAVLAALPVPADSPNLAVAVAVGPRSNAASARGPVNLAEPAARGETRRAGGQQAARDLLLDPRVAAGARIAMGITMALMLIIMI
jgi:hypothetical protein